MSESFLTGVTGLLRSLRGVPLQDRPGLMRQMARHMEAPEESLDGEALSRCLYCQDSQRCQTAFQTGHAAAVEKFCPNTEHFKAAATADR